MDAASDVNGWYSAIEWFAAMGLFFVLVAWQPKHTHPSKMRCECR